MVSTLLFVGLLAGVAPAPATQVPAHATAVAVKPQPMVTSISRTSVSPTSITFTATDPTGTPVVTGSASAVVSWRTRGATGGAWILQVSAPATFGACSTVPVSAVTVTCASVTGGFAGSCNAATGLSTTPTTVAGGTEGSGTTSYTATLNFTLQDSWKYIASSSCSLSVSYTITAN